jgi:hypothetical protein
MQGETYDLDAYHERRDHCLTAATHARKGTWNDYWAVERSLSDAIYRDVSMYSRQGFRGLITHFLRPTPDAVFAYYILDDVVYIHIPGNVVVTAHCLNMLRGIHIPSVLYWFRLAREHWNAERGGTARNDDFWTAFHNAMDHAMLIRKLSHFRKALRLNREPNKEEFANLVSCYKSGEVSGETVSQAFVTRSDFMFNLKSSRTRGWRSKKSHRQADADWDARGGRKHWPLWNDADWALIHERHEEIKASPIYNPDNHSMPLGPGGYPNPFIEARCPSDSSPEDYRNFLCDEFTYGWFKMDELCNWAFITGGSLLTLFLTFLLVWYANGGRDEMFGCQMTFYVSHMCT